MTVGLSPLEATTAAALTTEELRGYCCGAVRELPAGSRPPAGSSGITVFDRALMRPRIFVCDDIADAVVLEAVLGGHAAAAHVASFDMPPAKEGAPLVCGEVAITRCTRADIEAVTALDKAEWGAWANTLPFYRQLLDVAPSSIVIARDTRGEVAGFSVALVCEDGAEGWVLSVDVRGDLRGRGVGQKLVAATMRRLAERGCTAVTAIIAPDNLGSIALFESAGFEAAEIEENYFGYGKPQVRYRAQV